MNDPLLPVEPPANWWTRQWSALEEHWKATRIGAWMTERGATARWQNILPSVLIALVGFPVAAVSVGHTNDRVTAVQISANEADIYQVQLTNFSNATTTYAFCLDTIAAQITDRDHWDKLSSFIAQSVPEAVAFANALHDAVLSDAAPTTDKCTPPGPAPTPPN